MKSAYIFHHHHYYHALKQQIGKGIPIYTGNRQRGGGLGGILGFLTKYAIPIASKYILPHAKSAILRTASDVIQDRSNLKKSLKQNTKTLVKNIGHQVFNKLTQEGSGKISRTIPKQNKKLNKTPKTLFKNLETIKLKK